MTDFTVLDDPAWNALTTDHAALGLQNGLAARYRAEMLTARRSMISDH